MLKVVVAEDEALIALDIQETLEAVLVEVCATTDTAPDAVRLVEELRPDLVLMDADLAHGTDGVAAAREIRDRWGIPVILLSGRVGRREAEQAGAIGWLPKPFTPAALMRLLQDIVAHRGTGLGDAASIMPAARARR
ncbi:response regulator [Arenibaculum pallidiluteum]|uniref:response regulator n=1 Tax=Arenibaculum pallidiluteum TaxID=2812559 RepID=UPI001A958015|nr:response regulator [Arenibaculum pallidiluteum]